MNRLDQIIADDDTDRLTGMVQSIVLHHKPDEQAWSWPERVVVILGSMSRWVSNGGFGGYLVMPTSEAVLDCVRACREIGCGGVAEALDAALRVFPSDIDPTDVDARQRYVADIDYPKGFRKPDRYFFDHGEQQLADHLADFIRSNRDSFRWIDDVDRTGEPGWFD